MPHPPIPDTSTREIPLHQNRWDRRGGKKKEKNFHFIRSFRKKIHAGYFVGKEILSTYEQNKSHLESLDQKH
jgi:hypothetical protein